MVLQRTLVPTPAAGAEWSVQVPGQQIWDVMSVTATLLGDGSAGSGATLAMPDASGHALNGQYENCVSTAGAFNVAGLVTGDGACDVTGATGLPSGTGLYVPDGTLPGGQFDISADFTIEGWTKQRTATAGTIYGVFTFSGPLTSNPQHLFIQDGQATFTFWQNNAGCQTALGAVPNDTNAHYWACKVSANVGHIFCDGVEIASVLFGFPLARETNNPSLIITSADVAVPGSTRTFDEYAFYGTALSDARIAAHYAARGSFAGYAAAVLADNPLGYWHLDQSPTGPAPQVYSALRVTNGSVVLGDYTSGIISPVAGAITYRWSPDVQSVVVSGATALTQCPRLVLEPGYTLGSVTQGIGAGNQWSNVVVWWDDHLSPTRAVTPLEYLNVHLIPQRQGL